MLMKSFIGEKTLLVLEEADIGIMEKVMLCLVYVDSTAVNTTKDFCGECLSTNTKPSIEALEEKIKPTV